MNKPEQTNDQHLSDSHNITFHDVIYRPDIPLLQNLIANAHGVTSIITDTNGNPITRPINKDELIAMIHKYFGQQ
jgi:hypothetical protein